MKIFFILIGILTLNGVTMAAEKPARVMPANGIDKPLLGQILFFDTALSWHGNQNCATCHNADTVFVDLRDNAAQRMVSLGDDLQSFGTRNTQSMLYAKYSPEFYYDEKEQQYIGGQFWDGRAKNLAEQAGQPPLNPVEMGMPSKEALAERLWFNPMYRRLFSQHYGEQVWQSVEDIYQAMQDALAVFQQTMPLLAPFSSKYDKSLRGEYQLTEQEQRGKALFFDKQGANCASCHQLQAQQDHPEETFSNYHYYNLGVPKNPFLLQHNPLGEDFVDLGLFENPQVNGDEAQKGKFKVPSLRNVAVTAPYMHNGVFRELKTVLLFLDHYNNSARQINPETQLPWQAAEYATTLNYAELTQARALSDEEIEALLSFLKLLTDERYEYLLQDREK
ncbi:cytochrome-c peroxidase [Volucribacter amazonae]|uniref:Methylamine utilization protein MauG n=1 Tax=Volucribacter amazonae TaxID=256731 RepID=A0A9X4PEU3_9PAST|nr:cytochrome c peroxidase [Volucribacter amazonae]MDG6896106.1 methylamine utilization protein MauG [Volucribacter amazonae]